MYVFHNNCTVIKFSKVYSFFHLNVICFFYCWELGIENIFYVWVIYSVNIIVRFYLSQIFHTMQHNKKLETL